MTTWPFPEKPFEAPTKETGRDEMLKASRKPWKMLFGSLISCRCLGF